MKKDYIKELKTEQTRLTQTLSEIVTELKTTQNTSDEFKADINAAESFLKTLSKTQADDIGELINNITQLRKKISSIKTILSNQYHNDKLKQDQDNLKKILGQKLSALSIYFQNIEIDPYAFIGTAQEYLNALSLNKITEDNVVVNTKLEKFIKLAELAETMNKYYVLFDIYQKCEEQQQQDFYDIYTKARTVLNNPNSDISIIEKTLNQLNKSIQVHQNYAQQILTIHQESVKVQLELIWCTFQQNCFAFQQLPYSSSSTAEMFTRINEELKNQHQRLCNWSNQLSVLEQSLKTQLHTHNDQ